MDLLHWSHETGSIAWAEGQAAFYRLGNTKFHPPFVVWQKTHQSRDAAMFKGLSVWEEKFISSKRAPNPQQELLWKGVISICKACLRCSINYCCEDSKSGGGTRGEILPSKGGIYSHSKKQQQFSFSKELLCRTRHLALSSCQQGTNRHEEPMKGLTYVQNLQTQGKEEHRKSWITPAIWRMPITRLLGCSQHWHDRPNTIPRWIQNTHRRAHINWIPFSLQKRRPHYKTPAFVQNHDVVICRGACSPLRSRTSLLGISSAAEDCSMSDISSLHSLPCISCKFITLENRWATSIQTTLITALKMGKEGNVLLNLEGVFAAISWLANANGLQHPCVPQLPQHQAVAEPQGQLEGENQVNDE